MQVYHYEGYHGNPAMCGISIFGNTVVCTQLPENKGTSVTNLAEQIATDVCKEFRIDPERLIWIEHYPPVDRHEAFDLVHFNLIGSQFSDPKWTRIAKSDLPKYNVNYNVSIKDQW